MDLGGRESGGRSYQGARAAIEEFIDGTGARLLLVPIGRGWIAVKP